MKPVEIKSRIIAGTELAFKRLVEKKRKEGGYLILSEGGKIKKVMAKDIKI